MTAQYKAEEATLYKSQLKQEKEYSTLINTFAANIKSAFTMGNSGFENIQWSRYYAQFYHTYIRTRLPTICWTVWLHQVQRTFGARASLLPAAGVKFSAARNWSGRRTRWPLTFCRRTWASSGLVVASVAWFWCSRSSRIERVSSVGTHEKTYDNLGNDATQQLQNNCWNFLLMSQQTTLVLNN